MAKRSLRDAHGVIRNISSTTQRLASLASTQNLILLLAIEHFFVRADTRNTRSEEFSNSAQIFELCPIFLNYV